MNLVFIAVATFIVTVLGGLFALRFKDKSHLILSFSAGAVIGVAFFDLLPEALEISYSFDPGKTTALVALGFITYMILDRTFGIHNHNMESEHGHTHDHKNRGIFRASSISIHSLIDGIGIGLAFQVAPEVGVTVAIAVLAHDFSDGINTVTSMIKSGASKLRAIKWLTVDAIAPTIGIIFTMFFSVSEESLGTLLAIFCGFFIYIGASDLVPESYHAHPTWKTTLATICGILFLFIIINFSH